MRPTTAAPLTPFARSMYDSIVAFDVEALAVAAVDDVVSMAEEVGGILLFVENLGTPCELRQI